MRFTKFGKAFCLSALSAGVICGVTSCVESYTVGFLYVTGTVTASSGSNGIISGYKIDHNTGKLTTINGLPVSTGGANPVRAVLTLGSRFVYVLNRGSVGGSGNCTTTNPCQNANITQFAVGANGILTPQETFFTQGINPFRLIVDSSGSYLMVLDHDAPDSNAYTGLNATSTSCTLALGTLGTSTPVTSCGDITVFKIDQTTGRLSLIVNGQVTSASGSPLTYFPVPANPVDFVLSGGFILTLAGAPTPAPTSFPYTGGTSVSPYAYNSSSGQLTLSQTNLQPLTTSAGPVKQANAIVNANGVLYVLDNEPVTIAAGSLYNLSSAETYPSQILPYTIGTGGSLSAEPGGVVPDDVNGLSNPIQILVESKGQYVYVANQGNNIAGNNTGSGIAGYRIFNAPSYQLQFNGDQPFGSGSGPQCIVEDPSSQYIYEANEYDSTVTGRALDSESGDLNLLRSGTSTYTLQGPPTWCFMDGRTG
jgi:6-phosphogluconolactonase (cycloisomerase 2 family)